MDEKIKNYIESIVQESLDNPDFANFAQDQKEAYIQKVRSHFYDLIFDLCIKDMNVEQLRVLDSLEFGSPEMEEKLELFAATVPGLAQKIENSLEKEVEEIKKDPSRINLTVG